MESDLKYIASNVGQSQLSAGVASYLREQIMSGKLKEGDFLRIEAIATALSVSTTPVREGLLMLQSESFVRLIPRRGFVVNSFLKDDLIDLFWAQSTVAAELAARAATKMSDEDIERLQGLQEEHERAVASGNEATSGRTGHQFHRAINLAAKSPRLAMVMGSLTKQLPNRFYASIEGQLKDALEYHPRIIAAIRKRDSEAVRSLMFRHIMSASDHLVAALERTGMWGAPPKGKAVKRTVALTQAPVNGTNGKPPKRSEQLPMPRSLRAKPSTGRKAGAGAGTGKRKAQARAA